MSSLFIVREAPHIQQLHVAKLELENLLSDRKVELADPETVKNYVADLHNLLGESTLIERESFIRSFVKDVRVTGAEALMTYTIPMLLKGISREVVGVLPIVHYGGAGGIRTPYLLTASQTFSQLNYSPITVTYIYLI